MSAHQLDDFLCNRKQSVATSIATTKNVKIFILIAAELIAVIINHTLKDDFIAK